MDVERSIRSWMVSEKDKEPEKLVEGVSDKSSATTNHHLFSPGISSGSVTLLDIIKALGEYLTSEEDHLRARGMSCNRSAEASLTCGRCSATFFVDRTMSQGQAQCTSRYGHSDKFFLHL